MTFGIGKGTIFNFAFTIIAVVVAVVFLVPKVTELTKKS